ncbi:alpha-beta hydrolase superfamily lysophospholipase [Mycolicibacterium sp. BK556]|nr:alpha-beta hydrolase superfamily lysophospholipase [Mycolicibacterium sp. BK556]MBB3634614.1 alpha-beta hydrolase superfamily lysophospholipase [Mycolicibacterium sp. BK607]MBB3752190.1 alpha-beta hydrolase superfamily lysophospholipase [Mycolicibacterium sp. BK634]TDO17563.1 alpha-beta hydrolase superfamily lysophospholipase [Mycobacterium sp. BK086]
MTAARAEWADDVLTGYQQATMALGPDPDGEGDLFATLVRRAEGTPAAHTVLAVHGFTDYFFNTDLADHFAAAGFRFYALDQHKCGRSWREGQTPHFTTDLARYDRELERAVAVIATENPGTTILVYGHSAGGLIVSLWLNRVRRRNATAALSLGGLVLNSPWLDLHGPAILRTRLTSTAIGAMSRVRKTRVVRGTSKGGYGLTLHRDYHGEFDYNLVWKPLGGFPVTFGWIHAIRRGHATLHRGLDVGVPNLILRSDHSVTESADAAGMQRGDAVLDVTQIARWAGCIGNRTTIVPVRDAKHDVFLSLEGPRSESYRELDTWLDFYRAHLGSASSAAGRG